MYFNFLFELDSRNSTVIFDFPSKGDLEMFTFYPPPTPVASKPSEKGHITHSATT